MRQLKLSELLRGLTEDKRIDYPRIAREFDHIREVAMEGIRSAKEGSYLRVGSSVAMILEDVGSILWVLGERDLNERLAIMADQVRERTRPEVRPDESEAPRGWRLFEQRERTLTTGEIRRIAEYIVESGLAEEFLRRMREFETASTNLYEWLQSVPVFPESKSDVWDLRQVFEIEDELLRQSRGVGVVRP